MLVKKVKVGRKVRIDDEAGCCPQKDPYNWSPFKSTFSPANNRGPDKGYQNQQDKHVVGQSKYKSQWNERPILLTEETMYCDYQIDDGEGRRLCHVEPVEKGRRASQQRQKPDE